MRQSTKDYTKNNFRASLLDRLLDNQPWAQTEYKAIRGLNLKEYKSSILFNLSAILNTRSMTEAKLYDSTVLTVLDFGIPDFVHFSPDSVDDTKLLEKRITKAIRSFESRILEPLVRLVKEKLDERTLQLEIMGNLLTDYEPIHVTFMIKKQMSLGKWEIYETL